MHIAQVAPLYERVPPRFYGGTERVVSFLTEELVRMGHDVTLFASGDSQTSARLIPVCESGLRLDHRCVDPLPHHVLMLEFVRQHAAEFDVIHFHVDYLHFPLSRLHGWPSLTTYHGRLDLPDLVPIFREFPELPAVSISDSQRRPLPYINWMQTIYHGIPEDLFSLNLLHNGYLAFLGRISPEKGVDRAIELARQVGRPLKIAAKIGADDLDYYESQIRPLLREPGVEYLGEIADAEKGEFLGGAGALLFPITWPEPFGMVMIEAMASGTPVVAYNCGSVPEVVSDGLTGVIVGPESTTEQGAEAIERALRLDRWRVRQEFERRFTTHRMAAEYEQVYARLVHPALSLVQSEVIPVHG